MRVGPDYLNLVSIESAGVPCGGRYGRVHWFSRQIARYGLTLAWSRPWGCFSILCRKGSRWTFLRHLANGGTAHKPWRLGPRSLWLILYTWNRFKEQTPSVLARMEEEAVKRMAKERADRMERELNDDHKRREVEHYVDRASGRIGPKITSLPQIVVPRRAFKDARKKLVF